MNTNSTTTLGSTRASRVPVRVLVAATAALVAVAGATALVRTRADSPARPDAAAVVVDSTIDAHEDPLVARFGQAPSDPANDPLVIRYGRADATKSEDPLVIRFGSN